MFLPWLFKALGLGIPSTMMMISRLDKLPQLMRKCGQLHFFSCPITSDARAYLWTTHCLNSRVGDVQHFAGDQQLDSNDHR